MRHSARYENQIHELDLLSSKLRKQIADGKTISLEETLHEENIFSYTKQATGEKFLIEPNN